jgi:multidrug efflux system membrane fusion protein
MSGENTASRDESSHRQPHLAHESHPAPAHPSGHHPGKGAPGRPAARPATPHKTHPWVWILVAVGVAILVLAVIPHSGEKKAPPPNPGIQVSAVKATEGSIDVILDALGIVTPTYTAILTSRVTGELTEVHYNEGQIVKKGDLLAVIDPRPYEAVVMQMKGQLEKDQATLKNAEIDLTRYKNAYTQHAVTEQQVATQEATVEQDQGTIQVDQANLNVAQLNVEYTRIVSPIDGRVGLRALDPGNMVTANSTTALATVTQLQPITVIFTLAEDEIGGVADGMKSGSPLQVQALDRTQDHVLATGQLITLDNQINTTTGTVRGRANFANQHLELYPSQFVNARVRVKTIDHVILIPTAAIQHNNDQATVYVIGPDGKAQSKPVKVAVTEDDRASVTGINAGDEVITDGFDKLQNGSKVVLRGTK